MPRAALVMVLLGLAAPARADERPSEVIADLGLSVIHLGYEQPLGAHAAVAISAGIFGTYFLPWFDLGDNLIGFGGGLRVTWFSRASNRGFYVAPYVRAQRVSGDHDDVHETGTGFTAGGFAGWAFGIGDKVDVRVGLGAQYISQPNTSTAFPAIDLVVGYRL